MAAHGQRLRLRLFLEGQEIPVISAHVAASVGAPIMASIEIPPAAEGTRLYPRTLVHLFFFDDYAAAVPFTSTKSKLNSNSKSPTEYQNELGLQSSDPTDAYAGATAYRLLFMGELIGFVWNKQPNGRSLVLQCQDFSNYWDHAYQIENTGLFGPGAQALFTGGSTTAFTDFLSTNGSIVVNIVTKGRCNSYPGLKGLAAGIIALIETIGGVYYLNPNAKVQKKTAGQNLFFSLAELRLHITGMITALEKDPTTNTLLKRDMWGDLFGRVLGNLGYQVSVRKAIDSVCGVIFHEIAPQPSPKFVPGSERIPTGSTRTTLKDSPTFKAIPASAKKISDSLTNIKTSLSASESDVVSRYGGVAQFRSNMVAQLSQANTSINKLKASSATSKAPSNVSALLASAGTNISSASTELNNWTPGAPGTISSKLDSAISNLKSVSSASAPISSIAASLPARIHQQILKPDLWFAAPPRCNVLFPDLYDYLSYQRSFLEEPTRLMLRTNDEFFGPDYFFDRLYMAPQAGTVKGNKANVQNMLRGDLLDHELYTGILPVFEKSGEFNIFASKATDNKKDGSSVMKSSFAQRSANYMYFKYRFAARQLTVSGRFNPYVAVGFPGLIIDKYVDRETLENYSILREEAGLAPIDAAQILGTHFLASFAQVTHNVSQSDSGSRTEIACIYARQAEEDIEYLGLKDKMGTSRTKTGEQKRYTDVAAYTKPPSSGLGPNKGRITSVIDITASQSPGQYLPFLGRNGKINGNAPVNQQIPRTQLAGAAKEESDPTADTVVLGAYRINEGVAQYKTSDVPIPSEEFLRPGWYGDVWNSKNIGDAYETFFGTGSITEEHQVTAVNNETPETPDLELTGDVSIQDAVNYIVTVYSYIKQNNYSVDEFVKSYIYRPIATLVDLFGTSDLEYDATGETALSGIEGFHSRAFGPYENLNGLASGDIRGVLAGQKLLSTQTAELADTRKRKLEAVQQLAAAFQYSRGLIG